MRTASPTLPLEGDSATRTGVIDRDEPRFSPEDSQVETMAIAERPETSVSVSSNPMGMLQSLIDSGANPEALGKMMDLAERWQAGEAKRKWTEAVTAFKRDMDPIIKRNEVHTKSGALAYKFASYDDIKSQTIPLERKYGIATGFSFEHTPQNMLKGEILVTVGNHTERFSLAIPIPPGTQLTNPTQNFGMAVSYLKRYLYCGAFDIVCCGEDTDAAGLRAPVYDNPEQKPDAPKSEPRGNRKPLGPPVTEHDLAHVFVEWKKKNSCGNVEQDRVAFQKWAIVAAFREFDARNLHMWTQADLRACCDDLKVPTLKELKEMDAE